MKFMGEVSKHVLMGDLDGKLLGACVCVCVCVCVHMRSRCVCVCLCVSNVIKYIRND